MSNGLPEGWAEATLGDVITGFEAGRNLRSNGRATNPGECGVLKISAVTWGAFRPEENKALLLGDEPKPRERIRGGDLLITRANTSGLVGAVVLVARDYPELMLPDKILRLRPREDAVEPAFLLQALRTRAVREHFERNATGTSESMRNLSQPKMSAAPIALAPLPEQRRIVEAVEALLEQVNRAKERLERVPLILRRFRQAVLAAACSGELTPSLDAEAWQETVLGAVIDGFDAGRNLKSQGRPAGAGECGVLKISAVTWGSFQPEENKALLAGDEPRPHERIAGGDLLITRANTYDLVGAVVLVARDYPNLMLPDKILRLRLKKSLVDARFLVHVLRSKAVREHFESEATGTSDSMRNLSQPKMAAAPLVLPPLHEQAQVADAIEGLLNIADIIERRVQGAASRANRLPQAILFKAFSGELVPTEANLARAEGRTYETAEELLARVRHDPDEGPARVRRGRTNRREAIVKRYVEAQRGDSASSPP